MIGKPERLFSALLHEQLRVQLPATLIAVLLVALCGTLMVRLLTRPLRELQEDVERVREGSSQALSEHYPAEIRQLTTTLNAMLRQEVARARRQRDSLANLAHALRTPLTVIGNEVQSALVKDRVRDMQQLIDRSLARANSESAASLFPRPVPAGPIAERIVQSYARLYRRQATVDIDATLALAVDEADLFEVLGNVIENACRYGHTAIAVSHEGATLIVDDDGPGIPLEQRDRVVQRGVRLDESRPGHGIGLAVAAEIVASYDGEMRLATSPLGGLRVCLRLPEYEAGIATVR